MLLRGIYVFTLSPVVINCQAISNVIFLLISTISNILIMVWLFGVIIWDGSMLSDNILEGKWMQSVVDIFLDLINVILRVFELLAIFLEAFS